MGLDLEVGIGIARCGGEVVRHANFPGSLPAPIIQKLNKRFRFLGQFASRTEVPIISRTVAT
jgi:hypothetical protein